MLSASNLLLHRRYESTRVKKGPKGLFIPHKTSNQNSRHNNTIFTLYEREQQYAITLYMQITEYQNNVNEIQTKIVQILSELQFPPSSTTIAPSSTTISPSSTTISPIQPTCTSSSLDGYILTHFTPFSPLLSSSSSSSLSKSTKNTKELTPLEQLDILATCIKKYKIQFEDLRKTKDTVENDINSIENVSNHLVSENKSLNGLIQALKDEIRSNNDQFQALQYQFEEQIATIKEEYTSIVERLNDNIVSLEEKLERVQNDKARLEIQLIDSNSRIEEYKKNEKNELFTHNADIISQQAEFDTNLMTKAYLTHLQDCQNNHNNENDNDHHNDNNHNIIKNNNKLLSDINVILSLQRELMQTKDYVEEINQSNLQLKSQNEKLVAKIVDLAAKNGELVSKNIELTNHLQELSSSKDQLEQNNINLAKHNHTLMNEVEQLNLTINQLVTTKIHLQQMYDDVKMKLATMQGNTTPQFNHNDCNLQLVQLKQAHKDELSQLQQQHDATIMQYKTNQEKILNQITNLVTAKTSIQEQLDNALIELKGHREKHAAIVVAEANYQRRIEELMNIVTTKDCQFNQIVKRHDILQEKVIQFESWYDNKDNLTVLTKELEANLAESNIQLTEKKLIVDELQADLMRSKEQIHSLSFALKQQNNKVLSLQKQLFGGGASDDVNDSNLSLENNHSSLITTTSTTTTSTTPFKQKIITNHNVINTMNRMNNQSFSTPQTSSLSSSSFLPFRHANDNNLNTISQIPNNTKVLTSNNNNNNNHTTNIPRPMIQTFQMSVSPNSSHNDNK